MQLSLQTGLWISCWAGFLAITSQWASSELWLTWLVALQTTTAFRRAQWKTWELPDVCYSWWVLASMETFGRLHWIDREELCSFILACQDDDFFLYSTLGWVEKRTYQRLSFATILTHESNLKRNGNLQMPKDSTKGNNSQTQAHFLSIRIPKEKVSLWKSQLIL